MSRSSRTRSSIPAPRRTERPLDDARNARLTGPYRALWRAARNAAGAPAPPAAAPEAPDTVHSAMRRQVEALLADNAIDEADRWRILDSIACPCCGGAGASFTMTLRPASKAGF